MIRREFLNVTPHLEAFEQALSPEDKEHVTRLRQQVRASLV